MYYTNSIQFNFGITKGVKQILIWTALIFIFQNFIPNISNFIALFYYQHPLFYFWQPITYMFAHQGIGHILFNMLALWMFGTTYERNFGIKDFLKLYLLCGIGTGFIWSFIPNNMPMVGSSGAVYGLLVAFAYFWPNATVFLMGIFPIKAKTLVLILIGIGFFFTASPSINDNIAHLAHLIGSTIAFAYLQLKYKRYSLINKNVFKNTKIKFLMFIKNLSNKKKKKPKSLPKNNYKNKWINEEIDQILDKISANGIASLSKKEKEFLNQVHMNYENGKKEYKQE